MRVLWACAALGILSVGILANWRFLKSEVGRQIDARLALAEVETPGQGRDCVVENSDVCQWRPKKSVSYTGSQRDLKSFPGVCEIAFLSEEILSFSIPTTFILTISSGNIDCVGMATLRLTVSSEQIPPGTPPTAWRRSPFISPCILISVLNPITGE